MNPIVRRIKTTELDEVISLLKRSDDWAITPMGILFLVLTTNEKKGGKRKIAGTVGIIEGNRICYLAVDPEHRRKGYGKLLMAAVKREIKGVATLKVKFTNWPALKLYKSEGFKITGAYDRKAWIMTYDPNPPPQFKLFNTFEVRTPASFMKHEKQGLYFIPNNNFPVFGNRGIKYELPLRSRINSYFDSRIPKDEFIEELHSYGISSIVRKAVADLDFSGDWGIWQTQKGGAWTKRLEAYLYKTTSYKLNSSEATLIGNKLAPYKPSEYSIELDDKAEWKAGEFGDRYSCWLEGDQYHHKRDFFATGRGFTLKMYRPGTNTGLGRCWVYADDTMLYLFNNKGPYMTQFAKALSNALGMEYKPMNLYIEGRSDVYKYYLDSSLNYAVGLEVPDNHNFTMDWSKHGNNN